MKQIITILLLIFINTTMNGQNKTATFQEIVADFDLYKSENTHIYDEVDWTFQYNDKFWSSFSNDIRLTTPFGNWYPFIGFNVRYVYQKNIEAENYLELRPWMGMEYRNFILPNLSFMERMRIEVRNFKYFRDIPIETYGRVRNKVQLEWYFYRSKKNKSAWTISSSYEWYFLQAPAYDEQFSNSREFKTGLNWRMKRGYKLTFQYQHNKFLLGNNLTSDRGSSATIEFDF